MAEFIQDLYKLAEYCRFEDRDCSTRDRIVIGIRDPKVSWDLQEIGDDLMLTKVVEKAC